MLYYLLVSFYVLVCLLLIVVILLQQGKGGDIANAFGGGSSQAVFGARAGATLLTKLTTGLAAAFIILSLTLAVMGTRGPGSVVGGIAGRSGNRPARHTCGSWRPTCDGAGNIDDASGGWQYDSSIARASAIATHVTQFDVVRRRDLAALGHLAGTSC
jgi:preprotein translocase subunit SecG